MHPAHIALFWATETPALAKLHHVSGQTWLNIAICIVAVVIVGRTWRALKQMNDYAPFFAAALAGSMVLFYWVYNRNEPEFLTPIVEKLTFFLPTKDKQQQDLEKMRKSRDSDAH